MARSSVSGRNTNGVVTIVAETELTGITGLRLEVLPDSRLPSGGPGRASDGNFVLNELQLTAAPKADLKQAKPVKLEKALADFSQNDFDVSKAIDGSANDQGNGWAVSPATGTTHWATFETAQPLGTPGGTVLTIKLHHKFQNTWTLGRFRLSITRSVKPVGPSLPEDFRAILAVAPRCGPTPRRPPCSPTSGPSIRNCGARTPRSPPARRRYPSIPNFKELRGQLEYAKKPVQPDPVLVALRRDLEISVGQAAARRLTAAQDIAWALINSPAFLFNH